MDIVEEVTAYIKDLIIDEHFDMYFYHTPIPMLGNRTWEKTIEDGDEDALRKGLEHLKGF